MDPRTRRSPARFLAPLALIAVLVALMAIISDSGKSGSKDTSGSADTSTTTSTTTKTARKKAAAKKPAAAKGESKSGRTYTVQVGDTLGGIADKTGVPLSDIEDLNPNVDPHNMVLGQKIKLK